MDIKKYNNFLIDQKLYEIINESILNESIIHYKEEFRKVLTKMSSPISKDILDLENKDIKTNFNFIDTSKDGYLSFISSKTTLKYKITDNDWTYEDWPELFRSVGETEDEYPTLPDGTVGEIISIISDKNFSEMPKDGREIAYFRSDSGEVCFIDKRGLDLITKANTQEIKIGRLASQLLQNVKKKYSDKEIENFVNEFKSRLDIIRDKFRLFELVSGDQIRHFYNEKQYDTKKMGPLHSSCMKYQKCQIFFGIYTDNPSVCQLLILKSEDEEDKIVGRALIWKLIDGTYFMDRIYYVNDSQVNLFKEYAISKGWCYKTRQESSDSTPVEFSKDVFYTDDITVKLEKSVFKKYPYMDTLKYLDEGSNILSNNSKYSDIELESTEGSRGEDCGRCDGEGTVECPECGGDGTRECYNCDGNGTVDCIECDDGNIECEECDGTGYNDDEKCDNCKGSGEVECSKCDGRADIECNRCDGRGERTCGECGGDGTVSCPECNGD